LLLGFAERSITLKDWTSQRLSWCFTRAAGLIHLEAKVDDNDTQSREPLSWFQVRVALLR
jgi:hypothetical protein